MLAPSHTYPRQNQRTRRVRLQARTHPQTTSRPQQRAAGAVLGHVGHKQSERSMTRGRCGRTSRTREARRLYRRSQMIAQLNCALGEPVFRDAKRHGWPAGPALVYSQADQGMSAGC